MDYCDKDMIYATSVSHFLSGGGMEESYETFEEELWPPRADDPPQRPVRQIRKTSGGKSKNAHSESLMPPYFTAL